MYEDRQDHSADHDLEADELPRSEVAPEPQGMAHVHQIRLYPAFDPACALTAPRPPFRGGFFRGFRPDDANIVTQSRNANAEVGIFGDVERVPAAALQEKVAAKVRYCVANAGGMTWPDRD